MALKFNRENFIALIYRNKKLSEDNRKLRREITNMQRSIERLKSLQSVEGNPECLQSKLGAILEICDLERPGHWKVFKIKEILEEK